MKKYSAMFSIMGSISIELESDENATKDELFLKAWEAVKSPETVKWYQLGEPIECIEVMEKR